MLFSPLFFSSRVWFSLSFSLVSIALSFSVMAPNSFRRLHMSGKHDCTSTFPSVPVLPPSSWARTKPQNSKANEKLKKCIFQVDSRALTDLIPLADFMLFSNDLLIFNILFNKWLFTGKKHFIDPYCGVERLEMFVFH